MPWPPLSNQFVQWVSGAANWLDIVIGTVGFGFGNTQPGRQAAFLDLLFPFDTPSAQKQYGAKMSTCALAALSWLRCWGLDDQELLAPYRPGRAVSDIARIAIRHRAWRGPDTMPELGDIVLVGGHSQWGGTEHVFAVVEIAGDVVRSVDGGQSDNQGQAIVLRERPIVRRYGQLWLGSRRVMGVARINELVPARGQVRPVRASDGNARCHEDPAP